MTKERGGPAAHPHDQTFRFRHAMARPWHPCRALSTRGASALLTPPAPHGPHRNGMDAMIKSWHDEGEGLTEERGGPTARNTRRAAATAYPHDQTFRFRHAMARPWHPCRSLSTRGTSAWPAPPPKPHVPRRHGMDAMIKSWHDEGEGLTDERGGPSARNTRRAAATAHPHDHSSPLSSCHGSSMASMPCPLHPGSVCVAYAPGAAWSAPQRHGCHDQVMA